MNGDQNLHKELVNIHATVSRIEARVDTIVLWEKRILSLEQASNWQKGLWAGIGGVVAGTIILLFERLVF